MSGEKLYKPIWIILIFCICIFIVANQTRTYYDVCVSSPCSGLNNSSPDAGITDFYGESTTNLILAPTGFLIDDVLNNIENYDVRTYTPSIVSFDKANETFDKNVSEKSHLRYSYFIIKGLILINVIWWAVFGWLFYKILQKYKKYRKTILTLFIIFIIVFRLYLFFESSMGTASSLFFM